MQSQKRPKNLIEKSQTLCLAFAGREKELAQELSFWKIEFVQKGAFFFVIQGNCENLIFARDVWFDLQYVKFESISEATKKLKEHKVFWVSTAMDSFRRAELIQQGLPSLKLKPIPFLKYQTQKKFAAWLMLDANSLVYSLRPRSRIPLNDFSLVEDKENPPNRAYLKLWEIFTFYIVGPKPGDRVIDVGSSPGGWTWVLSEMGAEVFSYDKAPLREDIQKRKTVHYKSADVFKLDPKLNGVMDWFLSDIICTPEKLLELVQVWIRAGMAKNFVCTLKFKGDVDFQLIQDWMGHIRKAEQTSGQPLGDRVFGFHHLHQNKNEVTWFYIQPQYLRGDK